MGLPKLIESHDGWFDPVSDEGGYDSQEVRAAVRIILPAAMRPYVRLGAECDTWIANLPEGTPGGPQYLWRPGFPHQTLFSDEQAKRIIEIALRAGPTHDKYGLLIKGKPGW